MTPSAPPEIDRGDEAPAQERADITDPPGSADRLTAPASAVMDNGASGPIKKKTRRGKRGGAKRKRPAAPGSAETDPPAIAPPTSPPRQPAPAPLPFFSLPSAASAAPANREPSRFIGPASRQPFGIGIDLEDAVTTPVHVGTPMAAPATFRPSGPSASGNEPAADPIKKKRSRRRGGKGRRAQSQVSPGGTSTPSAAPPAEWPDDDIADPEASRLAPSVDKPEPGPPPHPSAAPAGGTPAEEIHGEAHHARLVLKPRPVRHARGGHHRRQGGEGGERDDAGRSQPVVPPAPPEGAAPQKPVVPPAHAAGAEDRPPAKRSRRRRRKKAIGTAPAAEILPPEIEPQEELEPEDDDIDVPRPAHPPAPSITSSSPAYKPAKNGREMIINVTVGAECRVAILHQGRLEELYIERQSAVSHVGNIYMGRITNVEPSIQAAFVDFGLAKNGFLHISDVQPQYFHGGSNEPEAVGKKVPRRDRPPIQKCFRRGDKVIVQVVKEGVGTKGPTLTTYLSIPGRFVVMMPGMDKLGVSRKIEDEAARRAMRDLLSQLTLPDGMGFILRTAGLDRNKRDLQSDLNYLSRLWKTVAKRIATQAAPCELYQESDLVIRTIRDVYSSDFERIVVDEPETAEKAREFLRIAMPRTPGTVVEYERHEPIFHYFHIEDEIKRLHSRYVPLPSGGSIVIDSTEAMVAIDVNSGKFRELHDAEETAYRINLEAAEEIARQLRLRDLGGLVVCDFIDMRMDRHNRAVEKALRDALKKHKERARILRMSKFGLIEMTRQRQRQSIKRSIFVDCPHCSGSGLVKTAESMSLEVIRILQLLAHRNEVARIAVTVAPKVSSLILNERRAALYNLEQQSGKVIAIVPDGTFTHDQVSYECVDHRGMPLRIEV